MQRNRSYAHASIRAMADLRGLWNQTQAGQASRPGKPGLKLGLLWWLSGPALWPQGVGILRRTECEAAECYAGAVALCRGEFPPSKRRLGSAYPACLLDAPPLCIGDAGKGYPE